MSCVALNAVPMQYSFIRDARLIEVNGEKTWVVMARSHTFESVPENSNYVRVDGYEQTCVMQSDGKKGSKGQNSQQTTPNVSRCVRTCV